MSKRIMRKIVLWTLALLFFAGSALANGIPSTAYARVGAWDVRVDDSLGHGCFIFASYPKGDDILRVGIDNTKATPTAYMFVGNPAWQSLVGGRNYTLSFSFDGGAQFAWHGTAMTLGGDAKLLSFPFDSAEFLKALARASYMEVFYQGQFVTRMNLPGTQAAIQALVSCQRQFPTGAAQVGGTGDPFQR